MSEFLEGVVQPAAVELLVCCLSMMGEGTDERVDCGVDAWKWFLVYRQKRMRCFPVLCQSSTATSTPPYALHSSIHSLTPRCAVN